MSNILVLEAKLPFQSGAEHAAAAALATALRARGHLVDTVEVPFDPASPAPLEEQLQLWRGADLRAVGGVNVDLAIVAGFPALFVDHPCKSAWFTGDDGWCRRSAAPSEERRALEACRFVGAASAAIAGRIAERCGFRAAVLPGPAGDDWSAVVDALLAPVQEVRA